MPRLRFSSWLTKLSVMEWVMLLLMVWISMQSIHVCHAADAAHLSDPTADSSHSGAEPVPSGSGQIIAFPLTQESADHMDGSSSSSGEAGPWTHDPPGAHVEEIETAGGGPREPESSPRTETFSGDILGQDDLTGGNKVTVTLAKREERTSSVYGEIQKLDDEASSVMDDVRHSQPVPTIFSPGQTVTPSDPAELVQEGAGNDVTGDKKDKLTSPPSPEDESRTFESSRDPEADRTRDSTRMKDDDTDTRYSQSHKPSEIISEAQMSSSADTGSKLPVTVSQMYETTQSATTQPPESPESSAEDSPAGGHTTEKNGLSSSSFTNGNVWTETNSSFTEGHMITKRGDFSIHDKDLSTSRQSDKQLASSSVDDTGTYTFSRAPDRHLTTADDIFTTQVETSKTAKSGSAFKVTSDQHVVSGSRTRRQTRSTNGLTLQHTLADFSSTVPSNLESTSNVESASDVESTSVMTSTLLSTSSSSPELTSDSLSTVPTPTTIPTTEILQTSTAASLGMPCSSDQSCASLNNTKCLQDVCSCQPGYHINARNESCIQEPYKLTVTAPNNTCVDITWSGGGDVYNVTVRSSVSGEPSRSEMTRSSELQMCELSPGANLTVSVALSVGGEPATTWIVLEPAVPTHLEISTLNETCFTATWQRGEGHADFYNLLIRTLQNGNILNIIGKTSDTRWTHCHLKPGTQFSVELVASSHGKNSTNAFMDLDSTVPSQPRDGVWKRNEWNPQECVDLHWTPGPGRRDIFNITTSLQPGTVNSNLSSLSTFTWCSLEPGSCYLFSIAAYSKPQYSDSLQVEACTDPGDVQGLRAERIDATWITLAWTSPSRGSVDSYIIRGNHSDYPIFVRDRITATVPGLSPGTTYTFNVTAEFRNLTSSPDTLMVMTNFSTLTSVNVSAMGSSLQVSWESDQDRDVPVLLKVRSEDGFVYQQVVRTSPHLVHTNRSGACFTVSLRVVNSSQVQTLPVSTEPAAPEEVQNIQAHRLTDDRQKIRVTWSPPAVTNGVIAFYKVSVRGLRGLQETSRVRHCQQHCELDCHDSTRTHALLQSPERTTNLSLLVDKLSEYENYIVNVTAFTSAGGGPSSSVLVEDQLLDSVTDLKVLAVNATCLDVTWSHPANAHSLIHYLIEYQVTQEENSSEVEEVPIVNLTNTHALLCGLSYWTYYQVNVTALDEQGPGRTSTRDQRTGEHVPGVVSNVSVSVETSIFEERRLEVKWFEPIHPYGHIHSYFVKVRDSNTSKVTERRQAPSSQPQGGVHGQQFTQTFRLVGDHHYRIQVFGATSAGNGSKEEKSVRMPAGVLPPQRDTVKFDSHDIGVRSLEARIPVSLLCNFNSGLPRHAGYILHHPGWGDARIGGGVSLGPVPVVNSSWAPSRTPFYVQVDVLKECPRNKDREYLPVRLGEEDCALRRGAEGGGQMPPTCCGPLDPNTQYQLLVVFCTSAACRYIQPAPVFTTRPQPEEGGSGGAGLAAGLTVVALLLILGAVGAFYWVYRKKHRAETMDIPLQPSQGAEDRDPICKSRPVPLESFLEHVEQLHKDSNLGFSEEFKTIKENAPVYSTRAAELPPCKPKNRYMNILPWDRSRVKLIPTDDEEGSDYINASYLPGENHQREFIAAQGPLPGTVDDFWRMVWENRVCVMVMLTQCVEKGKTKCEKYWPDEGVQTIYGDLVVQVRSQSVLPDYIIRVIDVKLGNQSRMIKHFHFMRWPDHGCPERTSMLLNFVSSVRAHMPHSGAGPTLVHCSAGVGRTGTFIALDRLLLQIRQRDEVDIFSLVFSMREHRVQMVQTENQYVYIHDCLADALTKDKESDDDQSDDDDEDEHIYGNC